MQGWWFILVYVLSFVFSGLLGVALLTYVRRTWQIIRAEGDESIQNQILDGIDQIQTQMHLLSERMDRMEGLLSPGPSVPELGEDEEGLLPPPAEND